MKTAASAFSKKISTKWEIPTLLRALFVIALLYLFLTGVELLGGGFKNLGKDLVDGLFEGVSNPVGGLFVGLLATVLVQSSSVSTSVIVGLVAAGVVNTGDAVPMIMGANLGTTVTNTLASLGHVRHDIEFKRAFAAATVHDFFNILAVIVFLPIELITGYLSSTATWLTDTLIGSSGSDFKSPLKEAVKLPAKWVKELLSSMGSHGDIKGVLMIAIGLLFIFISLAYITKNMRLLVADRVETAINHALGAGSGMVAILLGAIITISVQSSSITTSVLVPLAASGVLTLQNIYPVTLGANVGTTVTALLASLATGSPAAVTVAIVHTLFNISGIIVFYPFQKLRQIPINLANRIADIAVERRSLALAYTLIAFVIVPLLGVLILR
ncbi:MAG: Na/Pi symporter [Acidimicrobiales bacterium]|nr:Na/Pi symporter [Acidimicrobiales bacterium]MDP6285277.1 Na/Pi symporter [Acidimicrobiales bacterium]HJL91454.1 Na/Pi symporter [Acidimicrobiales bacterium]HJO40896.1 Na/Pi symporter [Acidimicrobiales bacterium]